LLNLILKLNLNLLAHPFKDARSALARADAHGDCAVAAARSAEFVEELDHQFRAGTAQRMAECDGTAVRVDAGRVEAEVLESIRALDGNFKFEVYMSLSCHNCPDVVQALSLMAIFSHKVQTVVIEGGAFQKEVEAREIMAVPMVFLNGQVFGSGRMSVEEIVAKLDTGAGAREAAKLDAKEPYDMLIVGGGPAGAAAAVYAARKGIRTGIAAENLGGQVNDTLGIENYISVLETDGPKLSAALQAHVKHYGVETMMQQRAVQLIPASEPGGLVQVRMENGGTLKARSVIISTGARWRNINVPGEAEYKNKGVAYCPHCDGPLFKGKRVAVIGGGVCRTTVAMQV
jgi:alkyl hydroperoxide reductase subunit F